jgi:electron transfer flavoprotein alpha subunit
MRIAALVKQIPKFEAMELGSDGRLVREGLELEMNAYCRRAVSKGVELAQATGGTCTVITLGPPSADDALREAIAWGADDGVLITDPAFAGSDTLATARALAAALDREGPFDLILTGRNSVDADTGQVGPEIAELLDLPFATGVKQLDLGEGVVSVLCEEDDGQSERIVRLPAVLSAAERLCEPCKVDPPGRLAVDAGLIRTASAADLDSFSNGRALWGQDGSGTYVGEVRVLEVTRQRNVLSGPLDEQVDQAVRLLTTTGALDPSGDASRVVPVVPPSRGAGGPAVAVVVEADRANVTRELLGAAAALAREIDGHVVAITTETVSALGSWGADAIVVIDGAAAEEDVAGAVATWAAGAKPWAILLPSTAWGREVGGRAAARLDAGLTGDAIDLEVSRVASTGEAQLLAWKPAFGGRLVAAIYCSSPIQMATVRAGVLPTPSPREVDSAAATSTLTVAPLGRVRVMVSVRDDDLEELATANAVIGVGAGVPPEEYGAIEPLLLALDAELAATRKVTDKGWQPRARQVGITGRSIAPRLYVAIGLSGKYNHMVGVRAAGTILAINPDPEALVWDHADVGIVGDWREVLPLLVARLERGA